MTRRWLHVLLTMLLISSNALEKILLDPQAENVCTTEERFNVTVEVDEDYWYEYRVTEWCFSVPPRCSKYKGKWLKRKVPRVVEHKRPIVQCCEGYTSQGTGCKPSCPEPCRHGTCARPNVCYCFPGFRGPLCRDICKRGTWGGNCTQKCECQNDAYCNPMNGVCVCSPGWRGPRCGEPCLSGFFGYECRRPCFCDGFPCHHITGECFYPTTESSTEGSTTEDSVTTTTENAFADLEYLFDVSTTPSPLPEMQNLEEYLSTSPFSVTDRTESTTLEATTNSVTFSSSSSSMNLSASEEPTTELTSTTAFEPLLETSSLDDQITHTQLSLLTSSLTQDVQYITDLVTDITTTEMYNETKSAYQNETIEETSQSRNLSSELTKEVAGDSTAIPQDVAGLIVTIVFSAFGSIVLLIAAAGVAVVRRRKAAPAPEATPSSDIGLYRFYAEDTVPDDAGEDVVAVETFNTFRGVDSRFQMELRELLEAEYDHPQSAGRGTPVYYDHLYDELNLPPEAAALNPKYF